MTVSSITQHLDEDEEDRIRSDIAALRYGVGRVVFEREVETECIIAAFLARCHVSTIGTPGVAKTFLDDVMTGMIAGLEGDAYFATELAEGSDVGELLGYPTVADLRVGRGTRNTARMLPRARVARVGEFWHAPAAATKPIQSILNEGVFYNGDAPERTNLSTLLIDSNGMPPAGHALADRFTFWLVSRPLRARASVEAMLAGIDARLVETGSTRPNVTPVVAWADIERAQAMVARIPLLPEALLALTTLHFDLQAAGICPSDRRIGYCVRVMKASAWLAGRNYATADDMALLSHVLWAKPDQLNTVRRLVYAICRPLDLAALDLAERLELLAGNYTRVSHVDDTLARKREAKELHDKVTAVARDLTALGDKARAQGATLELYGLLSASLTELGHRCLNLTGPPA